MQSEFTLGGIKRDNFLGFLSLLGLLKTLEATKSGWLPRVAWTGPSPRLSVEGDVREQDVASAAVDGLEKFRGKMAFGKHRNLKIGLDEFGDLQRRTDHDISVALGSDGSLDRDGKKVVPTPLCMMFGSGHQHFLSRLADATSVDGKRKEVREEISTSLFSEWGYGDEGSKIAFRWDPVEYRPHAYRGKDPSKSPTRTVNGANRLAAVGFTAYRCVPTSRGLGTVAYDKNSVLWPIWDPPLSLKSIEAIMRHPDLRHLARLGDQKKAKIVKRLRAYGVGCVMAASMFWDGKYKNVGVGEPKVVSNGPNGKNS